MATELFEETVLVGEVRFRNAGPTIFTRFGEWLALIAIAGAFAAALIPGEAREERRRKVQAAQSGVARNPRTP